MSRVLAFALGVVEAPSASCNIEVGASTLLESLVVVSSSNCVETVAAASLGALNAIRVVLALLAADWVLEVVDTE